MRRATWFALVLMVFGAALLPDRGARAQDAEVIRSPLSVLDTERLFVGSEPGQLFIQRYNAERDALIARNRQVEQELREEEQALTEQRATLTAEAFRDAADAFDRKVRSIREESERSSRDLERAREQAPFLLMRQAEAVLFEIMRETGVVIILDARQVLMRSDAVDITDLAIERINQAMRDQQVGDSGAFNLGREVPGASDAPGNPDPEAAPEPQPAPEPGGTAPQE